MKPQFTIEAFADWCEKRPAAEAYNICHTNICAVAQYANALGFSRGSMPDFSIDAGWRQIPIVGLTNRIMCAKPHTFGALAQRLRKAAA
jgi:hypothetical protein